MADIPDFSDDEWTDLIERLSLYSHWKLVRLRWRGMPYKRGGSVPGGMSATDLAAESISLWISGKRIWNHEEYVELFEFLKSVVDSKVNALAKSLENRISRRLDPPGDTKHPATNKLADKNPAPDDICANDEALERMRKALLDELDGDDLATEVLECLEADVTKPMDIAEVLGKEVNEINNAQKRLRRCTDKVMKKLGKA